jgi:hypothetical protein
MRAADDFAVIRARMEELQREREQAVPRKGDDKLIRRVRSLDIDERLCGVDMEEIAKVPQKRALAAAGG